VKSS
jgi:hypothetical protein